MALFKGFDCLGRQFEGPSGVQVALGAQFGGPRAVQVAFGVQIGGPNGVQVALGARLGGLSGAQEAPSCALARPNRRQVGLGGQGGLEGVLRHFGFGEPKKLRELRPKLCLYIY